MKNFVEYLPIVVFIAFVLGLWYVRYKRRNSFTYARGVKILMRLPDGKISAAHLSALCNRRFRHRDSLFWY